MGAADLPCCVPGKARLLIGDAKSIPSQVEAKGNVKVTKAELVASFNLNSLFSPIMIRIHFDILWTLIADTLYHRFTQGLRRFEINIAPTIFRKFIDMPVRVI